MVINHLLTGMIFQVWHVEFFVGNSWRWIPALEPTGSLFRLALGAWPECYHCGNGYGGFGCQGYLTLDGCPMLCSKTSWHWQQKTCELTKIDGKILNDFQLVKNGRKLQQIEVPSLERLVYKNAIAFYADEETRGFKRRFLCCHKRLVLWIDVELLFVGRCFFFSQEKRLRKAWNPKVPNTAMQIAMQVSCRSFTDLLICSLKTSFLLVCDIWAPVFAIKMPSQISLNHLNLP